MHTALLNLRILAELTLFKPDECPAVVTRGLVERESLVGNGLHVLAKCVECAAIIMILLHQWT